ncbi:hypothetical protein RJ641_007422 [Dillenia turbinata]|uniref:Uncharacterized protein n=1 Tax=Dillenia turbinata TaxID=194707 RepID=A0AAN8UZ79_9MAGN
MRGVERSTGRSSLFGSAEIVYVVSVCKRVSQNLSFSKILLVDSFAGIFSIIRENFDGLGMEHQLPDLQLTRLNRLWVEYRASFLFGRHQKAILQSPKPELFIMGTKDVSSSLKTSSILQQAIAETHLIEGIGPFQLETPAYDSQMVDLILELMWGGGIYADMSCGMNERSPKSVIFVQFSHPLNLQAFYLHHPSHYIPVCSSVLLDQVADGLVRSVALPHLLTNQQIKMEEQMGKSRSDLNIRKEVQDTRGEESPFLSPHLHIQTKNHAFMDNKPEPDALETITYETHHFNNDIVSMNLDFLKGKGGNQADPTGLQVQQNLRNRIQKQHIQKLQKSQPNFGFLLLDPGTGPRFGTDEDGCTAGDGAPKDMEATACGIFCFLHVADTLGLGTGTCMD